MCRTCWEAAFCSFFRCGDVLLILQLTVQMVRGRKRYMLLNVEHERLCKQPLLTANENEASGLRPWPEPHGDERSVLVVSHSGDGSAIA